VTTLVIILVLLVVAAVALAAVPLMIRSTRRQAVTGRGPSTPPMGSPAQVWVSRGERVRRELDRALADHAAWQAVGADADLVVIDLRATASQVAELDHALSQIEDPDLPAAGRLRATRENLLVRMSAAVAGLERARAELLELIATASTTVSTTMSTTVSASPVISDPDPADELTSRLAGLRAGLSEVRGLADPEPGSGMDRGGQGHP
jgi:hypothetical protein